MALASGIEPTGQEALQDGTAGDPFAERLGLDAPAGVLFAEPGRLALEGRDDPGLGFVPVAEPQQLGDDGVEPQSLDELHGVKPDIPVLTHLVHRDDVGMVQSPHGAGLAAEPLLEQPVPGHVPWQDLERHPAAQRDLLGLVHHAHPAPADLAEDPVVADLPRGWIPRTEKPRSPDPCVADPGRPAPP